MNTRRIFIQAQFPFPGFFPPPFHPPINPINHKKKEAEKILDLKDGYTESDIQKAFRLKSRECHPDKNPGKEKEAEVKFKRLTEAREVLIKKGGTVEEEVATHIFEQFMRTKDDDELDEAEDLFEFLQSNPNIFSFGPRPPKPHSKPPPKQQEEKESLNFRIRVSILDIWKNKEKNMNIENKYSLIFPLNYKEIIFEGNNSPFQDIKINLYDKPDPLFRRRGDTWDLETFIKVKDLNSDKIFEVPLPDGSDLKVKWKKEYNEKIKNNRDKGFIIRNRGFPSKTGRGDLWVRLNIADTENKLNNANKLKEVEEVGEVEEVEEVGEVGEVGEIEIMTDEKWWDLKTSEPSKRVTIMDLDKNLNLKK